MADINQQISLGIGSPSSIKFFTTFGLGIGEQLSVWTVQATSETSWSAQTNETTVWDVQNSISTTYTVQ